MGVNMANKSQAAEDQREIASFIEWVEQSFAFATYEFGVAGDKPPKFTRHDGYTFSMSRGDKTVVMTLRVERKKK
jgi:hypothetical protein